MTLITLNPTANSGFLQSTNASYTTARAGSTLTVASNALRVGQQQSTNYIVLETFLEFSISGIPAGSTINSVSLQLYLAADGSSTDFTAQVRSVDYGASLTTADWVPGANLGSSTLLATLASSGVTANTYNSFTENSSNFRSAITIGGTLRFLIASDRTASGTAPTGTEYLNFAPPSDATNPAKLVIDYTAPPIVANLSATATLSASGFVTHFGVASLHATATLSTSGFVTHFGAASLSATATITAIGGIVTDRSGLRSGERVNPLVTLRLHTPLPDAAALIPVRFATPQTSLVITTSVERGFESCQIGFPTRENGIMRLAWLPEPVLEYRDYGHAVVADGTQPLFVGRTSQAPQFVGGQIRAITATGYWDALNDDYFASSDATVTTTGAVIRLMLTSLMPWATIDEEYWQDPGVPHAPSEFDNQRGGQAIDSLLKEGSSDGSLYDLQFWCDQNGASVVRLVSRTPPAVPDYEVPWYPDAQVVNLGYDPTQLYSHVRARYTPAGGSETVTDWQPALTDTSFADVYGLTRKLELAAGQKTQAGAEQLRDTTQALQSTKQWGGTIRSSQPYPLYYAGSQIPVPRREVVAGQWLRVLGLDVLLQIQRTQFDVTPDTLQLTVSQGVTMRTLQQKIVQTVESVRAARNPISGAPEA